MTDPVEIQDLSFSYPGEQNILQGVSLSAAKGEVLAIVGLSGSGKSTLCYCIGGIIPHILKGNLKGKVLIEGKDTAGLTIPYIATKLGIVFQDPDTQLFSPTVEDEVAFGPENLCLPRYEIGERITNALRLVNMEGERYSNPQHLSGGQKQLIALASVLSLKPKILVFDESMSQIDAAGRRAIKQAIKDLKDKGRTIIMVEHELNNLDIADRVMVLRKGKLEAYAGSL